MRLGILGGTFDPVHYGHLLLAETCRQELQLDEVRWIPTGNPPHKTDQSHTEGHVRADMLQLALSGYPEHVVDRREIGRDGPSWTVDTLSEFAAEYPEHELFFLMGADSLRDFSEWKQPEQIARLSTIAAVNRPGFPLPSPAQVADQIGAELADHIRILAMPGTDISATDLRQRVRDGRGLRFLTPRAVEAFIAEHGLYDSQTT